MHGMLKYSGTKEQNQLMKYNKEAVIDIESDEEEDNETSDSGKNS